MPKRHNPLFDYFKRSARGGRRPTRRRNWPKAGGADEQGARELALYAPNTHSLYQRAQVFVDALAKKKARGQYDAAKAVKLWEGFAKEVATAYNREMGRTQFSPATRREAAKKFEAEFRGEVFEAAKGMAAPKRARANPRRANSGRVVSVVTIPSGRFTYYSAAIYEAKARKDGGATYRRVRLVGEPRTTVKAARAEAANQAAHLGLPVKLGIKHGAKANPRKPAARRSSRSNQSKRVGNRRAKGR